LSLKGYGWKKEQKSRLPPTCGNVRTVRKRKGEGKGSKGT